MVIGFILAPYYAGSLFGILFFGSLPPALLVGWVMGAIVLLVIGVMCRIAWQISCLILKKG